MNFNNIVAGGGRRRLMMSSCKKSEPAPPGVVWYKRLIFDANTSLDLGFAPYRVTWEWEVEWTRTINTRELSVAGKNNYASNREVQVEVRQYYGPVSYGYFLYSNSVGIGLAASPALNVPSTFILSRETVGGDYTLTVGNVSCTQASAGRDNLQPLRVYPGQKELRRSILRINGMVVQNLRPCTYYGEPGMWDTVNEVFIGNASQSGNFSVAN